MKILLFSDFGLPDSCANATRVMNFAKLLQLLECDISVLGVSYGNFGQLCGIYDGISYEMIKAANFSGVKAYKRVQKLEKDLNKYLQQHEVPFDAVLLSNVYYDLSNVFLKYSKKYGTKLIMNSVEWYDKNNAQFDGLFGKINLIKNRIALKKIHVKMGNIIAISSLLDDYYKERGCNTVTIPTIIDMKEYEGVNSFEKILSDEIHIAYAGSPGRKDYVINAIYALELLSADELKRIRLDFNGTTYEKLCAGGLSKEYIEKYKDNIVCHGRIPYDEVKGKVSDADFTVLLRPDMRYANAGFPTKVGESMACGTPVICNITSDLGRYVLDGKTGIVCENESKEACAKAFKKALSMSVEQRAEMRNNALSMAKKEFDYKVYAEKLSDFLKKLK